MASYTTRERVEAFIKREMSENEIILFDVYLSAVQKYIDSKIGGSFGSVNESVKYYDGGKSIIDIDKVYDVSAVKELDSEGNVIYEFDIEEELRVRPLNDSVKNWIEKRYGCFSKGIGNIGVWGKFSLGDVPEDIKYISSMMVGSLIIEGYNGKMVSESIEGYSRNFAVSLDKGELSSKREIIDGILLKYMENEAPLI